jgi:hypothetical protein
MIGGRPSEIETSQVKDLYGFTYHRLKPERSGLSPVQVAAQHVRLFDLGRPADTIFAVQRCTICGARVCELAHFVPKPIMHLFRDEHRTDAGWRRCD